MPEIEAAIAQLQAAWISLQPAIDLIKTILMAIGEFIGGVLVGVIKILWDIGVAAFGAIAGVVNAVASAIGGVISAVQEAISWFQNLIGLSDKASGASLSASGNFGASYNTSNFTQTNYVTGYTPTQAASYTNSVIPQP